MRALARLMTILPLLLASACASDGRPHGRWVGSVAPTTTGTTCTESRGVLQITQGSVMFAPDDGTWILRGSAEPDGAVVATRTQVGVNKQPFETKLEARWTAQTVKGTYTTPRCKFDVLLTAR